MAGLFSSLFKNNDAPADNGTTVLAPVSGTIKPIDQVPDETFASKLLGDGFAVVPSENTVLAPVTGTVTTVANAKHAVGITTEGGVEVLIHIGVDTVEMNGAPFTTHVEANQKVEAGTPIVDADFAAITADGKATDVIVVFTNPDKIEQLAITATGNVAAASPVGTMKTK